MHFKYWFYFLITFYLVSCTAPKFSFEHNGISELDFENGKWILNDLTSNRSSHDLNRHSFKKWGEIVKDSLFSLKDLRANYLIKERIDFDIDQELLKSLARESKCDFLINTRVEILNEELFAFSKPRQSSWGNTFRSNEAKVEIRIYDLNKLKLVSSRVAYGTIKEEARSEDEGRVSLALTVEGIARNGIDRILTYYMKNSIKTE